VSSECDRDQVGPGLPQRAEFIAVGDAHEVAIPRGLKFRLPNRISNPVGRGPSCPWNTSGHGTRCESPSRGLVTSRSSARIPYMERQLSVQNVVPTLTSNER
jgi:hypothetical protein